MSPPKRQETCRVDFYGVGPHVVLFMLVGLRHRTAVQKKHQVGTTVASVVWQFWAVYAS